MNLASTLPGHANDLLRRTLVTGDTGFVGRHVLALWPGAIGLSTFAPRVDIRDKQTLLATLKDIRPSAVLHLAALSFVPESFRDPETTYQINFVGTLHLLEALAEVGFDGRFIFVGSGDTYGLVSPDALPIDENTPLRPRNPYAVSKVAAEALCYQWSQTGPFEVIMARPFNHIGAGQSPAFAISDFARQLAEIGAGIRAPLIKVGNIEATRDFIDVADIINAYHMLLQHGRNGEIYNVCSGIERSVRGLLDDLIRLSGVRAEIAVDLTRYRPAEQPRVCGSCEKLSKHTGWRPTVSIEETLLNIYHYWEQEIGK